jgi:hypothetical protein
MAEIEVLSRGELIGVLYRLGRGSATGVLSVTAPGERVEVLVLRRGQLITADRDVSGREASARLARLVARDRITVWFEGGTAAYPPGALRQLSLVTWVRHHLENQLDAGRAGALLAELAGARVVLRPEHAPEPVDDVDRRMLAAMAYPRRLDQIWPLARTPRFRLLAFIHFLRGVGAIGLIGVAAQPPPRETAATRSDPHGNARRLLGVTPDADVVAVKRAYHRLARALHPDLHGDIDELRRRELERRLAEVTAAYQTLASA